MRALRWIAALVAVGTLTAGCGRGDAPRPQPSPSATPVGVAASGVPGEAGDPAARAARLAAGLDDLDLIGQVLMPYAYGSDANTVSPASAAANRKYAGAATPAEIVAKYRLGGLILTGWSADDPTATANPSSNVESADQVRRLTGGLQQAGGKLPAKVPLLIGVDQEYGVVTRVRDGAVQLPSAMGLGAAGDPALTERAWRAAAGDLARLGITLDFAPDADVLAASGSAVIGSRSFGADPKAVSDQVAAAVRGLQGGGVAATLKHFPGHGRTTADSHTELPVLAQNRATLDAGDLPPFKGGIAAGAAVVMGGHLRVDSVDPGETSTFSSKVLIDLLRRDLGFTGLVISDAMNMAPAKRWPPGEAAVRALLAGNDVILMPPDLAAAHAGLVDAARSGRLPRARLLEAATRVLTVKLRFAGVAPPAADPDAAAAAAAGAVTVLRGACKGPLVSGAVSVTASGGRDKQKAWLAEALRAAGVRVADSGGARVHLVGYGDGPGDLAPGAAVTVAMDTPYLLGSADSATRVATYASTRESMVALSAVLAGRATAPGRSPVPVNGLPRSACRG